MLHQYPPIFKYVFLSILFIYTLLVPWFIIYSSLALQSIIIRLKSRSRGSFTYKFHTSSQTCSSSNFLPECRRTTLTSTRMFNKLPCFGVSTNEWQLYYKFHVSINAKTAMMLGRPSPSELSIETNRWIICPYRRTAHASPINNFNVPISFLLISFFKWRKTRIHRGQAAPVSFRFTKYIDSCFVTQPLRDVR